MALRPAMNLTKLWKSMAVRSRSMNHVEAGKRCFASSTIDAHHGDHKYSREGRMKEYMKGELAPIYMVLGLVVVAVTIGTHTAKQQLMHSPTVSVSKKKRESLPEVEDPDTVISSADHFVNKSFLRKLAHIQEDNKTLHDPIRPDPFTRCCPRDRMWDLFAP